MNHQKMLQDYTWRARINVMQHCSILFTLLFNCKSGLNVRPLPEQCKKDDNLVRTSLHIWVGWRGGVLVVWDMITEGNPRFPPPSSHHATCLAGMLGMRFGPHLLHAICRPSGWSHSLRARSVRLSHFLHSLNIVFEINIPSLQDPQTG